MSIKHLVHKYKNLINECREECREIVEKQAVACKNNDHRTFLELEKQYQINKTRLITIKEVLEDILKLW